MNPAKLRVFIVDDHALFREGLVRLLDSEPDMSVCGRAGSLAEARASLVAARPDIVLLDIDLGQERGVELMRDPAVTETRARVLVVTAGANDREAVTLMESGAAGILHKHRPPSELCDVIRRVARGEMYLESRYIRPLLPQSAERQERPALTPREVRILRLIFQGMANKEIADDLNVAESTVKAALRVMFDKLGVRTRSQLVRIALEQYRDQL